MYRSLEFLLKKRRHYQIEQIFLKNFQTSLGNGKAPIPTSGDIESIYKILNLELNSAMFDQQLQELVIKNIEKSIQLYIAKIEGLVNRTTQTAQENVFYI